MSPYLFAFSATRYTTFSDNFHHTGGSMPVRSSSPGLRRSSKPRGMAAIGGHPDTSASSRSLSLCRREVRLYQFPWRGGIEHQTATGRVGTPRFQNPWPPRALPPVERRHGDLRDVVGYLAQRGLCDLLGGPVARVPERNVEPGSPSQLHGSVPPDELDEAIYIRNPVISTGLLQQFRLPKVPRSFTCCGAWSGPRQLLQLLEAYREQFEFSAATSEDFRQVAEEVWDGDLGWFFDEWSTAAARRPMPTQRGSTRSGADAISRSPSSRLVRRRISMPLELKWKLARKLTGSPCGTPPLSAPSAADLGTGECGRDRPGRLGPDPSGDGRCLHRRPAESGGGRSAPGSVVPAGEPFP